MASVKRSWRAPSVRNYCGACDPFARCDQTCKVELGERSLRRSRLGVSLRETDEEPKYLPFVSYGPCWKTSCLSGERSEDKSGFDVRGSS